MAACNSAKREKLHSRARMPQKNIKQILVSWQQLTHQKREKLYWRSKDVMDEILGLVEAANSPKREKTSFSGQDFCSQQHRCCQKTNSVPSTRHCWLNAEDHTPFLTCWWDEVHTTVSTNPCWAQYHISLPQRVCHTVSCYTSRSCLMFIICRTDKWSRSYWTCPQSHHTHYTITST